MTLRLNGSTSGYIEIDAPAAAGSNTLVLPTGNGSANQALVTDGSGALSWSDRGRMTLATAQNSTSGTAIDFTGIPSWVKRVTVMLNGVSLSGSSIILIQLGTSGGVETTGYAGTGTNPGAGIGQTVSSVQYTTGFGIGQGAGAAVAVSGLVFIATFGSSNQYIASGTLASTTEAVMRFTAGNKTLSGTLDRIRITTVSGTDAFDAGSINLLMEG